ASWWVSAGLPGAIGFRQSSVAQAVHPGLPGARLASAGCESAGPRAAAILDDAGALPRPDLEGSRTGPLTRGKRADRPPVSRPPHRPFYGSTAPPVARELAEAAGQGAEGLRPGHRAPTSTPQPSDRTRAGSASQVRRFLGRVCDRGDAKAAA